jgi:hypothetical protein
MKRFKWMYSVMRIISQDSQWDFVADLDPECHENKGVADKQINAIFDGVKGYQNEELHNGKG